jgi:anti-sigma B factor antagonist
VLLSLPGSAWQPWGAAVRQYREKHLASSGGDVVGGRDIVGAGGSVRIDVERPGALVVLVGRLGATTVADVRNALSGAIDAGEGDLVVDLAAVELADATGLGVLVGTHRRADRAGRRLVLRHVPERIDRLLLATRLHRVLYVERAVAAAS